MIDLSGYGGVIDAKQNRTDRNMVVQAACEILMAEVGAGINRKSISEAICKTSNKSGKLDIDINLVNTNQIKQYADWIEEALKIKDA